MLDYRMKVSEELTFGDMASTLHDLMNKGIWFLFDLLQSLGDLDESLKGISQGLDNIATSLRDIDKTMAQNGAKASHLCAMHNVQTCVQNKEAVPSSPLSSPLKEDEESSKEVEENNPPIIPPSPSEENCVQESARAELDEIEQSFEEFWNAYDYKINRKRAWKAWKNLSKTDRKAAMEGLPAYKANCDRFQRPWCHPVTYLNQRRWEDDFNSGLRNADIKNGRNKILTREDIRNLERQQRMEGIARVAAEFRAGDD